MAEPSAGLGLPEGATERRHRLLVAQDVDGLQKPFEPLDAEEDGGGDPILRDGDDVILRLEIPDQVQQPSLGLGNRDEAIYLLHGTLLQERSELRPLYSSYSTLSNGVSSPPRGRGLR